MRALPKDIDAIPAPSRLGQAGWENGPPHKATGAADAISLGGQVKLSCSSGKQISCTTDFNRKPAIAGQHRDQDLHESLPMDRVTRFAPAQPEASDDEFPKLSEQRAGSRPSPVLAENDERNEPASRALRGIPVGHIVLERNISRAGPFPTINVLAVVSPAKSNCRLIQKKDECATLGVGAPEEIMGEGKGKVI